MLTVLTCLAVEHDLRFVALAALICVSGSTLAMRLLGRARRNAGVRQLHLVLLAGLVAGGTIWTTHFAAMLGYRMPLDRAFEPTLTFLSLGIVVATSLVGFLLTARGRLTAWVEVGGAAFGFGIAAMHYCGMAAFQVPGYVMWNRTLVIWSVVLAVVLGALAVNRIARPITRFCQHGGVVAMVLAIVLLHFTGMAAATVVPMSGIAIPPQALSDSSILTGVLTAIALILMMAGSAYTIDLAAAREASDSYQRLALHDPLTGLPNRHQLAKQLGGIRDDSTAGGRVAVLAIDLDRFKDVNDVHGHGAGDTLLRVVASRISAALGPQEIIARMGGDEFVAIKQDVFARGDAVKFARKLRELIVEPVEWQNQKLSVGCSIGIAVFPEHGDNGELIASRADLAMYRAKSLGRGKICTYEPAMDEASRSRAALAIDLKRAVAEGQFELHYQPQNDTSSGAIVGFEALLRWNHPDKGRVSPAEFIPIAEETGLIIEIGDWVMRTACAAAAKWRGSYTIAVNVAPLQLTHGNLPKRVAEILAETGLAPHRLEIELTESSIIADQQHALQVIMALKGIGVTVAMDDFGTGYSSLSTLQNFPFDKIKVDRSFIQSVASNAHSAAIVKATLLLGKSLHIPVLAEGVETEAHLAFLREQECPSVQGYLFGKPMPIADVEALIEQATTTTAVAGAPACDDAPALAPDDAAEAPAVQAA